MILNSMFCLNRDCVLIISLYRERFYVWSSKVSSYIGNIGISKIVISGFCPIYFTVTFARTYNNHRSTVNIVISRIVIALEVKFSVLVSARACSGSSLRKNKLLEWNTFFVFLVSIV